MRNHSDISVSTNPLRSRMVRAVFAVGTVLVLISGAIGIKAITNAAPVPQMFTLNYSDTFGNAVAPEIKQATLLGTRDPNASMTIELYVPASNQAGLTTLMRHLYTKGDPQYRHWLTPTQYHLQFAPTALNTSYLTARGLQPVVSASPYLLRFTGTTKAVESAMGVTINTYRLKDGRTVYANANAPRLPLSFLPVKGILGLDSISRAHPRSQTVTNADANPISLQKNGYGASPGANGLTASQIQSLYLATPLYSAGYNGASRSTAVYELSEYTHSDIAAYDAAAGITAPRIYNIDVDGGPCDPGVLGSLPCSYGASEVELDIEMQQAIAPGIRNILVYNGPNDTTGGIDTYFKIANDNLADSISTGWGQCEPNSSSSQWNSEFGAFEEMAMQGQSLFAAAGDSGPFDCAQDFPNPPYPTYNGTDQVDDPASNPYITAVGGTSFNLTYNPGSNVQPTYPAGKEYVWNTVDNCSNVPNFCPLGAGGGGNSKVWARPAYQANFPGVNTSYSQSTKWCGAAQCRELPDVSLNADPFSGVAIYCTDVGGGCPTTFGYVNGWLQIGGTGGSAAEWAGIAALAGDVHHQRIGLINWQLYTFSAAGTYPFYFHDLNNGVQVDVPFGDEAGFYVALVNSNGCGKGIVINFAIVNTCPAHSEFPEAANYDMATGVGTPRIYYDALWLA